MEDKKKRITGMLSSIDVDLSKNEMLQVADYKEPEAPPIDLGDHNVGVVNSHSAFCIKMQYLSVLKNYFDEKAVEETANDFIEDMKAILWDQEMSTKIDVDNYELVALYTDYGDFTYLFEKLIRVLKYRKEIKTYFEQEYQVDCFPMFTIGVANDPNDVNINQRFLKIRDATIAPNNVGKTALKYARNAPIENDAPIYFDSWLYDGIDVKYQPLIKTFSITRFDNKTVFDKILLMDFMNEPFPSDETNLQARCVYDWLWKTS